MIRGAPNTVNIKCMHIFAKHRGEAATLGRPQYHDRWNRGKVFTLMKEENFAHTHLQLPSLANTDVKQLTNLFQSAKYKRKIS